MITLDIIAGHFLPSLFGWIFLLFVLATESLFLSKYLTKYWQNKKIITTVVTANLITTIVGFFLLDTEKTGGHLLNWIPVDQYNGSIRLDRTMVLFVSSFIGTILIEALFNLILLKKQFNPKRIIWGTIFVNAFTYAIAGITILLNQVLS